jgi:hypothetical protein
MKSIKEEGKYKGKNRNKKRKSKRKLKMGDRGEKKKTGDE